jgi:hypothetical protein
VTLGYSNFVTAIGTNTSPLDHTKNCQLHLNLNYQGGFSYAVVDAVYHGYAQLDQGVTGSFLSTYFFSQNAANSVSISTLPEYVTFRSIIWADHVRQQRAQASLARPG